MITVVRTGQIQAGDKTQAAFEWAVRIASYARETFGTDTQVMRNIGGRTWQLHWVTTYESLAEMEEIQDRTWTDQGYMELLAESGEQGLFAMESAEDHIYKSVP